MDNVKENISAKSVYLNCLTLPNSSSSFYINLWISTNYNSRNEIMYGVVQTDLVDLQALSHEYVEYPVVSILALCSVSSLLLYTGLCYWWFVQQVLCLTLYRIWEMLGMNNVVNFELQNENNIQWTQINNPAAIFKY